MEANTGQTQVAYNYIREKIMNGEMLPGNALTALELSKQIGVSRTPVRDALRQLETEGLVTITPNIGATVRSLSVDEFREHCFLRLALETFAAGEAARLRQESDLRDMEAHFNLLKEHYEKSVSGRNAAAHARLRARHDICFHLAVVGATRNQLLKREVMRLCIMNRFVSNPSVQGDWENPPGEVEESAAENARRVVQEHKKILDAIREQDVPGARAAMEAHLQRVIEIFDRAARAEHQKRLHSSLRI
jgi:DNA-binding GntR family transcriptional regulator